MKTKLIILVFAFFGIQFGFAQETVPVVKDTVIAVPVQAPVSQEMATKEAFEAQAAAAKALKQAEKDRKSAQREQDKAEKSLKRAEKAKQREQKGNKS